MAKRRKISAPSADDLDKIEAEFRRETLSAPSAALAPISQVSAESAQASPVVPAAERASAERDKADAKAMRVALEEGRVIAEIPIEQILGDAMIRDRTVIDPAEMNELKSSIAAHGLRLPVEVFERDDPDKPYGLLSGYRRLWAVRDLLTLTEQDKYKTIKAIVRDPDALGGSFAAMVEENEIRAQLSHYERGRIAVVAAQQGAFSNTEEAVGALFSMASKAKRSKIRSFSLIFEELGDLLAFPENLKEKDGLRLSTALRNGAESQLRSVLDEGSATNPEEEWQAMEPVIEAFERSHQPTSRGGRPRKSTPKASLTSSDTLRLSSGVTLQSGQDSQGYIIRVSGSAVDSILIKRAMEHLQYLFEKG